MCELISYQNWIWIIDCEKLNTFYQKMLKEKMNEVLCEGSDLQLRGSFANFDFKANEPATFSHQVLG